MDIGRRPAVLWLNLQLETTSGWLNIILESNLQDCWVQAILPAAFCCFLISIASAYSLPAAASAKCGWRLLAPCGATAATCSTSFTSGECFSAGLWLPSQQSNSYFVCKLKMILLASRTRLTCQFRGLLLRIIGGTSLSLCPQRL